MKVLFTLLWFIDLICGSTYVIKMYIVCTVRSQGWYQLYTDNVLYAGDRISAGKGLFTPRVAIANTPLWYFRVCGRSRLKSRHRKRNRDAWYVQALRELFTPNACDKGPFTPSHGKTVHSHRALGKGPFIPSGVI